MDFLKKQWNKIVRYQFWILSSLVFVLSIVVFYLTSSSLSALIGARETKLKAAVDQISKIRREATSHPNGYSHKQMENAASLLEADIKQAWGVQFNSQRGLMKWPKEAFARPEIQRIFESLRPVEQFIDFPIQSPLPPPFSSITTTDKAVYKKYIGEEFANVSAIIGTEWKAKLTSTTTSTYGSSEGGMSGMSGMGGDGYEAGGSGYGAGGVAPLSNRKKDLVRWSASSQQTLLGQIAPWYSRPSVPSILEIYYTQEDMWILNGIMEIIKLSNGDAIEDFQTVVREIEWVRMGKHASRNAGVLTNLPSAAGSGMYGGMEGGGMDYGMGMAEAESGSGGDMYGGKMGGMAEGESGADPTSSVDPVDGRYLSFAEGTEFEPRKGEEIRAAIREISPANAVDAVVKRVPVRLRLKVDRDRYSEVILACGSANLKLEVYQVRENTDPAPATAAGAGGMGGMGGMGGYEGGMTSGGGGGGKMSMPGESGMGMGGMGGSVSGDGYGGEGGYGMGGMTNMEDPTEISIEIFGLIYLYNPVNIKSLGTEVIAEKIDQAAAATTSGANSETTGTANTSPAATTLPVTESPATAVPPANNLTAPNVPVNDANKQPSDTN